MTKVVAVIGSSGSGKTTTIEHLTSNLSKRGLRIGSAKNIHHPDFTIDKEGKDTWRHVHAGSKIVASVAPREIVTIRKRSDPIDDLEGLLKLFRGEELDIIFLEGFHSLVAHRPDVYKIVTATDSEDLRRTLKDTVSPILTVTGKIAQTRSKLPSSSLTWININKEFEKLIKLIVGVLGEEKQNFVLH